jgi:hypothetical protein
MTGHGRLIGENAQKISVLEQVAKGWDSRHAEICTRLSNMEAKIDRLIERIFVRNGDRGNR